MDCLSCEYNPGVETGRRGAYGAAEGRGAQIQCAVGGVAHHAVERGPDGWEDAGWGPQGRVFKGWRLLSCTVCLVNMIMGRWVPVWPTTSAESDGCAQGNWQKD